METASRNSEENDLNEEDEDTLVNNKPFEFMAFSAYAVDKFDMEESNKVLLPPSFLSILMQTDVPNPMIFSLKNVTSGKKTYVGVIEFLADEGCCFIPQWLFEQLGLFDMSPVTVTLEKEIPKGNYMKIRPLETAFIELPDPRSL